MIRALILLVLVACRPDPRGAAAARSVVRSLVEREAIAEVAILHTLTPADGLAVRGALTELGGRLYGLAGEAGPNGSERCNSGASWQTIEHTAHCPGSLFSVALDGSEFRVEHAFTRLDDKARTNADGYHPYGTLAVGPDRRLFGVAQMGGSPRAEPGEVGYGVLFAFDPQLGGLEVLHTFGSEARAVDGEYPMGAVAIDVAGNVFGTTKGGGATSTGTVWEWSPGGAFRFAPLPGETYGGLALAGALLHGTTWGGGTRGIGVYFVVDASTLKVTVVDSFPAFIANEHGTDNTPIQEPIALSNGAVIAPREFGGAAGAGVLVALDSKAGIRVLHESADIPLASVPRFSNATGGMLNGRLAEGRDGMLYGVAQYGGAAGTGGIYRVARDGSLFRLLWSWPDAAYPYGGVTIGSDGALYGTTFDTGQIWRLALPLAGGSE